MAVCIGSKWAGVAIVENIGVDVFELTVWTWEEEKMALSCGWIRV